MNALRKNMWASAWAAAWAFSLLLGTASVGHAQDASIGFGGSAGANTDTGTSADASADADVDADIDADADAADMAPSDVSAAQTARHDKPMWLLGAERHHMSRSGSVGLFDVKEAGSGSQGSFAFGVMGAFTRYNDYLIPGDEYLGLRGDLLLRVTPLRFLELRAGARALESAHNMAASLVTRIAGDFHFGLKGFFSPVPFLTLGLDASVLFLRSVTDATIDAKATGAGIEALMSMDFTELNPKAPLRFHLGAGYVFDNSAHLVSALERQNGGCGSDIDGDGITDYAGCLGPISRTIWRIDRVDHVDISLALDALLPFVSPIVEYRLEVPVNRQDFVCPSDAPGTNDHCLKDEGISGMRQYLNLGVRILPPLPDLAIDLGVQIGLTGYAPSMHELAPQWPWALLMGMSYTVDPRSRKCDTCAPAAAYPPAESAPSASPVSSFILGTVVAECDENDDAPQAIEGALIQYENLPVNAQVTDARGFFQSYPLNAGPIKVWIRAPGFVERAFDLDLPPQGDVQQVFALTPAPRLGVVSLAVRNEKGEPIEGARIAVTGAHSAQLQSDSDGAAIFESPEGDLQVKIDAPDRISRTIDVAVALDSYNRFEAVLMPVPAAKEAPIKAKQIRIRGTIQFKTDSDEIEAKSLPLLDEVAATLRANPQIEQLEIQGHTDDRGKLDYNLDLSERRAKSVRTYLVSIGIDDARLLHKGYGPERAIAPNFSAAGRAKNRRVEFHILD
ncbi:MAG: OmpA family protein [Myxococcales bacterium]|nr:OmpA family protein [Myxococcales bacterium]